MHRVAAYFAEALTLRMVRMWPQVFDISPPRELTNGAVTDDDATALRVLNVVTPTSVHNNDFGTFCIPEAKMRSLGLPQACCWIRKMA
jgi:hypothetical protein